jgi:hypothetical protein
VGESVKRRASLLEGDSFGWLKRPQPTEVIALVALAGTPLALFADYRLGLPVADKLVTYRPFVEARGRPVTYHQILGVTQILWMVAAIASTACRPRGIAWRTLPVVALTSLLVLIVAVTQVRDGVDETTALTLSSTLLPLICIVVVTGHPILRCDARRDLITVFVATTAVVVIGTIGKDAVNGTLSERFDTFLFGSTTDTGIALAGCLVLVPASRAALPVRLACALASGVGLLLTQTRGAVLAAACGGIAFALMRRRLRIVVGIAVAGALTAYLVLSDRSLTFGDKATSFRRLNLEHHWDLFTGAPIFGYGVSEPSLNAIREAHNTLLAVANAAGALGLALWLAAWLVPVGVSLLRGVSTEIGVAASTTLAVFVAWNTTGSEVFIYSAPTNLLPIALSVSLATPAILLSKGWPPWSLFSLGVTGLAGRMAPAHAIPMSTRR